MLALLVAIGLSAAAFLIWQILGSERSRRPERAATTRVQDSFRPASEVKAQRDPVRLASAQPQTRPPDDLISALGSSRSDLHAIYKAGISADADAHQKYVAHQIANMCISAIMRRQYAEASSASGDKSKELASARAAIAKRCSPLEREGIDQLTRDMAALGAQVESEGSTHSRSYANFRESRSDTEKKAAVDRMQALFSEYGASALQWESGDFSDYIRYSDSKFSNELRLMSENPRVTDYAVILALCDSGDLCGSDGLFYLWLCSEHGNCGGSVQAGLLDSLSPSEVNTAKTVAAKILDGISTGAWAR
jgi:hypothetical protein